MIKLTFGLPPMTHRDDPALAVRCGLVVRDQVRSIAPGVSASIGIASGQVFIGFVGGSVKGGGHGRGEYTEYGVPVNLAARLMGLAINEVLVSQSTHLLAKRSAMADHSYAIDFDEMRPHVLKGITPPDDAQTQQHAAGACTCCRTPFGGKRPMTFWRAVEARGEHDTEEAGHLPEGDDGPFFGHDDEVRATKKAMRRYANSTTAGADGLRAEPKGFVVTIQGDPGSGKSKLLTDLTRYWAESCGAHTVWLFTSSDVQGPYYVFRQIFRTLLRVLKLAVGDASPALQQRGHVRAVAQETETAMIEVGTANEVESLHRIQEVFHQLVSAAPGDAATGYAEHLSLLTPILDVEFGVSEATLALSLEEREEMTRRMITHMMAQLPALLAARAPRESVSPRPLLMLMIDDADRSDLDSWDQLRWLCQHVSSLGLVLTMPSSAAVMHRNGLAPLITTRVQEGPMAQRVTQLRLARLDNESLKDLLLSRLNSMELQRALWSASAHADYIDPGFIERLRVGATKVDKNQNDTFFCLTQAR